MYFPNKVLKLQMCLIPTLNQWLGPLICSVEPYAEPKDIVEKIIVRFSHHLSIVKTKKSHQNYEKNLFHNSNSWNYGKNYKWTTSI